MVPIDHYDEAAELNPSRIAAIDDDVAQSYAELSLLSHRIAAAIAATRSYPGEAVPVAIFSPNDHRVIATMLGTMRAGGVIVPLHARNNVDTNIAFMNRVGARCLFYHSSLVSDARMMKTRVGTITHAFCIDRESDDDPTLGVLPVPTDSHYHDWIDACGNPSRPAFFWQTSGTTGEPKVVVNDCGSFDTTHKLIRALAQCRSDRTALVSLAAAPLSHAAGPYTFTMLTLGATIVVQRSFDAPRVLRAIEHHHVTDVWLPPTALYLLLDDPDVRKYDLSSLRRVQLGAAAVSPERLKEAVEVFGPCVSQTYGQIESGPLTELDAVAIARAVGGDRPERLRSSGTSIGLNRFAIMAEDGRLLPSGEEGEIVVRGRCVKPYLNAAETDNSRRHGWHHTGDVGYLDDSGFLYVTGRQRDVVITAGFKVAAAEVEGALMQLPEVHECAVIAEVDEMRGEVIKAVVVARAGHSVSGDAIRRHCRTALGPAKTPVVVEQWLELPKSAVGKIDKRRIRELSKADQGSMYRANVV